MHTIARQLPLALFAALAFAGTACARGGASVTPGTSPSSRPSAERPITTGLDVLRRMRAGRGDSMPRSVSFVQANTVYLGSGQVQQRWRVIVSTPMRMRMDYLPLTTRTGFLYLGDDVHAYQTGRKTSTQAQVNPTLLLLFGVASQPVETTQRLLDSLGVRSTPVRRDTIAGRRVWVVGAEAGDVSTDQLWIDAERWIPLRVIDRETRGTRTTITDTRYTDYVDHGGLSLPSVLLVYRDRRLALKQELRDVRVNPAVPEAAFDPARWVEAQPPL